MHVFRYDTSKARPRRTAALVRGACAVVVLFCLAVSRGTAADAPANVATNAATLDELRTIQARVQDVLQRAIPCTVSVEGGTGVVVGDEGYVLTVAHLGRKAGREVSIVFPDGRRARGKVLGDNFRVDAAVAKITDPGPWPHLKIGDSDQVKPGQWCVALGYPVSYKEGEPPAVRLGRVLAVDAHAFITDCTIMGGDSGGPLLDLDGNVIGISSRASGSPRANVQVLASEYTAGWDKFLAGRDWRGCRHEDQPEPAPAYLGIGPDAQATDARIGTVFPDSPAAAAGLKPGDVVVIADGRKVASYEALAPMILRKHSGDSVKLTVRRGENERVVDVTLGEVQP